MKVTDCQNEHETNRKPGQKLVHGDPNRFRTILASRIDTETRIDTAERPYIRLILLIVRDGMLQKARPAGRPVRSIRQLSELSGSLINNLDNAPRRRRYFPKASRTYGRRVWRVFHVGGRIQFSSALCCCCRAAVS